MTCRPMFDFLKSSSPPYQPQVYRRKGREKEEEEEDEDEDDDEAEEDPIQGRATDARRRAIVDETARKKLPTLLRHHQ